MNPPAPTDPPAGTDPPGEQSHADDPGGPVDHRDQHPAGWPDVAPGGRLVAFVPDLMDRSRIRAARPDVQFLTGAADLETLDQQDVVLVDLGRPAARSRLTSCPAQIIGFVAHVDREVAEQARRDGAAEVLARSVFFRRLQSGGTNDPDL